MTWADVSAKLRFLSDPRFGLPWGGDSDAIIAALQRVYNGGLPAFQAWMDAAANAGYIDIYSLDQFPYAPGVVVPDPVPGGGVVPDIPANSLFINRSPASLPFMVDSNGVMFRASLDRVLAHEMLHWLDRRGFTPANVTAEVDFSFPPNANAKDAIGARQTLARGWTAAIRGLVGCWYCGDTGKMVKKKGGRASVAPALAGAPLLKNVLFVLSLAATVLSPSVSRAQNSPPEIAAPPPSPWNKPLHEALQVSYRINGSYKVLLGRLMPLVVRGRVSWRSQFHGLGELDLGALLQDTVQSYGKAGNARILEVNAASHSTLRADIFIEMYLSDSRDDAREFDGLVQISNRAPSNSIIKESYIRGGWVGVYSSRAGTSGAACLLVNSAFSFREQLAVSEAMVRGHHHPHPMLNMWRPFGHLIDDGKLFRIGYFELTQRWNHLKVGDDRSGDCRQKLRIAFEEQWRSMIQECVTTALGTSVSDVGPQEVARASGGAPFYKNTYSHLGLGSRRWVAAAAAEFPDRNQEAEQYNNAISRGIHLPTGDLTLEAHRARRTEVAAGRACFN